MYDSLTMYISASFLFSPSWLGLQNIYVYLCGGARSSPQLSRMLNHLMLRFGKYGIPRSTHTRSGNTWFCLQLMIGWLCGFYGISTSVGYLMPNPFLYESTVLFQTIQFGVSTQFNCQKHYYFKQFSLVKQFSSS